MTAAPPSQARTYDVIVVGGGPAGSVMGWALATQGVRVAVLERAEFPREKVCGDYVEPGGLRILARIGVLSDIERGERLKINRYRAYFGPQLLYNDKIHYYRDADDNIDYGLVVPRHELDAILLDAARDAGATVLSPATAKSVVRKGDLVEVEVAMGDRGLVLRAPLVVGADGTESVVAKSAGLRRTNRRHIGVSQRAYVDGVEIDGGEATVWFDEDITPGYGWMFPMPGGRANVGVGFGSEASHRFGMPVRESFQKAIARLRIRHPGCANARLVRPPIGGVVKSYGGIDRNHFAGGLLIGDAGSFVDALTGEGITQGMESAILALPTLMDALERNRFEADDLASFERDFRGYFDPSMRYLELAAALVCNRHMAEFWYRVIGHGHEEAARDHAFAGIAGSVFGGPGLQPLTASVQTWSKAFTRLAEAARPGGAGSALSARFAEDFRAFQRCWTRSSSENPDWHAEWLRDVLGRTFELQKTVWTKPNLRPDGVFRYIGMEGPPGVTPPIPLAQPAAQAMVVQTVRTLIDAGLAFLSSPATSPAPQTMMEPKRRWRIKS